MCHIAFPKLASSGSARDETVRDGIDAATTRAAERIMKKTPDPLGQCVIAWINNRFYSSEIAVW